MINLKIPKKAPSSYFWYFYHCIEYIQNHNLANVEYFNYEHKEHYVMHFYFNNKLIWIDLRDDNKLSPTYQNSFDSIILKSNYSSELWDNMPENFPYKFQNWEHKLRPQIRPFILGRAFGEPYRDNKNSVLFQTNSSPIYEVFSLSGTGLLNSVSIARLKTYNLFKKFI